MKKYLLIAALLSGCGDTETIQGLNGTNGVDGANGSDGAAGSNGLNSLVTANRSDSIDSLICEDSSGVVITVGLDDNNNNILDASEQDSVAFVCDGLAGPAGPQGPQGNTGPQGPAGPVSPMSIVSVIDPCGDAPGIYDEVLLKLQNGTIIASFSDNANGKNTRFSLLVPGNYVTTDDSSCAFNVSPTLVVTW